MEGQGSVLGSRLEEREQVKVKLQQYSYLEWTHWMRRVTDDMV
jgi:hypothetical protein